MPKIKPERIAGIVALSYLVLIPAGAFLAWRKLQLIEHDVDVIWEHCKVGGEPQSQNRWTDLLKGFSPR